MKEVKTEDINAEQIVGVEDISTSLAIPQDAMSFLAEQPVVTEFGFAKIKPNKGAASFNIDPGGTVDSPLYAVIMEVDFTRTLWPFGDDETVKRMQEWSRSPICSSRNEWAEKGLKRRGGILGVIPKEEDEEAPEMIKNLIMPVRENRLHCNKCEWAQYGSAFSGSGQACKEQRRLLIYLPDRKMCGILVIPPASLKGWEKFSILAGTYGKHWSWAVVEIKSVPQMKGNIEYSTIEIDYAKEKKAIAQTTPEMMSGLNVPINYNGIDMILAMAVVYKFRSLEPEIEYDSESGEAEF
jgi:hypothetical protein